MENHSLGGGLNEMLDREEIRTLPNRYCHCVWREDIEGLVDLFSLDGAFEEPSLGRVEGKSKLLEVYRRALNALTPKPFIHNHVILTLKGELATGACYVELRAKSKDGGERYIAGYYDDEYVKENGRWKFRSRKVTLLSPAVSQDLAAAAAQS